MKPLYVERSIEVKLDWYPEVLTSSTAIRVTCPEGELPQRAIKILYATQRRVRESSELFPNLGNEVFDEN